MAKSNASEPVIQLPIGSCPICGKPATAPHRPFCSGRCADIDLGRWLKGNYRVETDEEPEEGPPPAEA